MSTPADTTGAGTAAPAPAHHAPAFHPLRVARVTPLTDDSAELCLAVPTELRDAYGFVHGQHLTVRMDVDGEEQRRSYSITTPACDAPVELCIGVRRVDDGVVSRQLVDALQAGDTLEVMTPAGRFTAPLVPGAARSWLLVAAGSGITPILGIARTVLAGEPQSSVTLVYGNRSVATIMFREQVEDLKDRYLSRLNVVHLLSRERRTSDVLSGRIDAERLRAVAALAGPGGFDEAFVCGPEPMPQDIRRALLDMGMASANVHVELFTTGDAGPRARPGSAPPADMTVAAMALVRINGIESEVPVHEGERILDAALRAGLDVPYACTGGVCSTCRAHVEGEVQMVANHALEADEVARGYALTCQSTACSDRLVVDYDRP